MRHSTSTKEVVRKLRFMGNSLYEIKSKTNVPVTTIRTWIKDIILTPEQRFILKNRTMMALQEGNKKAKQNRRDARQLLTEDLLLLGKKEVSKIKDKEFFIAGIALYWAEGFKNLHERRLGFCNSDPAMIIFYIRWLQVALGVGDKELIARVTVNKSYEGKIKEIERYWSKKTGIPLVQFTKPFYQETKWKKEYANTNYRGVLRIHVKDSLELLLKMRGWIEGLKLHVLE